MSGAAASSLPEMLGRLKLTVLRDRLDVLLDEAARRELNLPEALGLLCAAEVAHREERQALRPLSGKPPFRQMRELTRCVQNDGCVDVDTNHYSVPWQLIGAQVSVVVNDGEVRISHAGAEVACHGQRRGRRERAVDRVHLRGIVVGDRGGPQFDSVVDAVVPGADLLRPLAEYEQVAGGGW